MTTTTTTCRDNFWAVDRNNCWLGRLLLRLFCRCTALDILDSGEMTEQNRLWCKVLPSQMPCILEDLKLFETLAAVTKWRSSDHWLPGEDRCIKRKHLMISLERAIVNQMNIGMFSKATLEKLWDSIEHIWAFLSSQIPSKTERNWTKLRVVFKVGRHCISQHKL